MTAPPASIQIGPLRYTVEMNQRVADAAGCWGRIEFKSQTIALDPDQAPDHMAVTLLHEVLHGCWKHANVEGHGGDVEKEITALAPTLLDVLQRNPEFVVYLMQPQPEPRRTAEDARALFRENPCHSAAAS